MTLALTRARGLFGALKRRPRLLKTLEVTAAVLVVGLCIWGVRGEWAKAWPELEQAKLGYVALSFAAVATYYLVFIFGWIRILAQWGIRLSYGVALQAEMVSMLAKYVPGGVWTPAARVAAVVKLTGEKAIGTILASVLVEAVLSAVSGVLVFVVSLLWVHDVDVPLAPIIGFALACIVILHPAIFGPLMTKLMRPFGVTSVEPLPLVLMGRLLVFYCGTWLIGGCGLYFLICSLGEPPGLETIPFLGGTAAIGAIVAVLVVFAPSGLGVREASMYACLIAVTTNSVALGVTILNRLVITLVELVLFLIGVVTWRRRQAQVALERAAAGEPQQEAASS